MYNNEKIPGVNLSLDTDPVFTISLPKAPKVDIGA
jgi:hypothetical protein